MIIAHKDAEVNKKWAAYKRLSRGVAVSMIGIPQLRKRGIRMKDCAQRLEFAYDAESDRLRLSRAYLCRDRLCPVCNWRLGLKRLSEAVEVMQRLAVEQPRTKAIHVVLTVRNCAADALGAVIRQISDGFTRLRKRRLWTDYISGYARSIEITYNDRTHTYHPHIHIVAIVPSTYTRQISIGDWVSLWRECCQLNYNPVVWASHAYKRPEVDIPTGAVYGVDDITAGLEERSADERLAALREAIKYAIKPNVYSEMLLGGDTLAIASAVAGIKLISYGGILKRYRRDLGYTDHDAPDLAPEGEIDLAAMDPRYVVVYEWALRAGEYRRVDTRP